jgi:hypothetical protein
MPSKALCFNMALGYQKQLLGAQSLISGLVRTCPESFQTPVGRT